MRLVVILCLASVAFSRPQDEKDATIVDYFNELRENQNYDFSLETSNGIIREESGVSYPGADPETGSYTQSGSYEFTHPDGTITYLSFIADEDGYRAESDAIPVFNGRVDIQDV
ncbi:cuticle protein CP14.6-like [Amphibalanus amphitrite]|uniref:cuticle protein CP14.6-like n=1 Tax=Amphibalanus amphitrite TaxID=1232801 RepID=UPI001C91F32D|nr:cuticle protein CP14.6-like [Amphibalanus amphitrite]